MPLTVSHALSATTPDDPTYEIRPSHWNSAHVVTLNASGSEISGAFSNAGNVTFGLETNGFITASANAAGAGDGFNRIAAGTQTAGTNNTIVFANSNGVTFGMSGSTQITASHNGITQQSTQPVAFSAPGGASNFSTLVFANSNGVSWSNSNGSIVGSVATNYLTTARASNDAVGLNTALTAGPLAWTVNSAGLSLNAGSAAGTTSGFAGNLISGSMTHNTAGLNLSLDHPAWLTTAAQSNHSHGNPTLALTNLSGTTASNSNGLTLSLSAAAPGGGGNFSAGVSNLGNTGGDTGVSGTRLVLVGSQNITLNQATDANGLTVSFSGGAGAAGNTGFISAGTATASLGTVIFSNSNGVSFGVNGQTVTASIAQLSAGVTNAGNTSGNTGFVTGQFNLQGGNNITLSGSTNGGSMSVTVSALNQAFSASGGSSTFQTLEFQNSNGISFSNNAGSIRATYTVPTVTNSSLTMQAGASTLSSVSRIAFADSNGVSFGASTSNNGSITITATVRTDWLSTQSNQALSGSNGSFTFQTATFGNLNGLSFYSSNGSMVGSYTVPTQTAQTLGLYASSQTTAQSSSSTVDARSLTIVGQGNISVGLSGGSFIISQTGGGGGVNPAASASNGSFAFTTLNFSNANNVTFGTSAGGIITASVAAPGAAAENNNINLLGANTAGNTTASGSTIGYSGINLTLSGTNGSVVNISAPATSSLVGVSGISLSSNGSTVSVYHAPIPVHGFGNYSDGEHLTVVNGQNTILFQPMFVPAHIAFSEVVFPINYTNATNSSNSCTLTMHVGIYTRNASSLSLFTSTSSSYATTNSGTAGNASLWLGKKNVPVGFTSSLTPGQYWLALRSQTTTGGGAGMSFSNYHFSNQNTVLSGRLGVGNNASDVFMPGMGSYSATSTAMPGSVAFTEIRGSAAAALRGIAYYFGGANV